MGGVIQNIMHIVLHFYMQKTTQFPLRFYILKQTLCVTFIYAKKITLRYVFILKIYCIVYSDT